MVLSWRKFCIGVQVPFVGDSSQLFSGTLALVSKVSGTSATFEGVASASGDAGSRPGTARAGES